MDWKPNLKNYPHFDAVISLKEIEALVRDPDRVATNTFYPFMRYEQRWQPFRQKKNDAGVVERPDKKQRPIRFASRRDAYILSFYRHLLAECYEAALVKCGAGPSVIAYRKLKDEKGRGKSNIDFAADAFTAIRKIGNCAVVTLDISGFFESLDHTLLKARWCRVLGVEELPPDHAAVFRAMTRYAVVDREAVYERLGFLERQIVSGKERLAYTRPFHEMPKKLCTNSEFREKICGVGGAFKSLVDVNRKPYGIPQGAPISDLLANIYMIDFDCVARAYCVARGGEYYRYSDDIMMILPGDEAVAHAAKAFATSEIRKHGDRLKIKDSKTTVAVFDKVASDHLRYRHILGRQGRNGLEYLGFRFGGDKVAIRDSTLAKLYRKISLGLKAEVASLIRRYPGHDEASLAAKFDYSQFFQRYGRVQEFDGQDDFEAWTFWTYARRAFSRFGVDGAPIPRQLRRFKMIVRSRVPREIAKQLARA